MLLLLMAERMALLIVDCLLLKETNTPPPTLEETMNITKLREYETTAERDSKSGEHRRVIARYKWYNTYSQIKGTL